MMPVSRSNPLQIEPYLYFNGRCEEALTFYQQALGARTVALNRFGDNPDVPAPLGAARKIMHAEFRVGGAVVLASDGPCTGATNFQGFSLALTTRDGAEAERMFGALADGGSVQVPLGATPFAVGFGMVADRFGVVWTITAR